MHRGMGTPVRAVRGQRQWKPAVGTHKVETSKQPLDMTTAVGREVEEAPGPRGGQAGAVGMGGAGMGRIGE